MKPFKFLTRTYTFKDITLSMEIIEATIELCEEYNRYVNFCREDYLRQNPRINRNSDYAFPIPHNNIEREFPEGLLWHGGSDYYEEEDLMKHFVYIDSPGDGEIDDYFFEINEDEFGGFHIHEIGRDRSRWD